MSCPNTSSPQWQALVDKIGVREAYREFAKHGDIPSAEGYTDTFRGVNATMKVLGAISSDKGVSFYNRFFNSNRDRYYQELYAPGKMSATKEQVDMLKSWIEKNNPQTLADMQAGIASEMSYTVEIKEATERAPVGYSSEIDAYNDDMAEPDYYHNDATGQYEIRQSNKPDWSTGREVPTSHYSNMTVPGGTNYRENEIRTPEIVPVRQGHAAFSTENGIGWFRSDDRRIDDSTGKRVSDGAGGLVQEGQVTDRKTRRILEIQSDLFQKERGVDNLSYNDTTSAESFQEEKELIELGYKKTGDFDDDGFPKYVVQSSKNQFLQLLSKENNWVTFFTKAIIQDSTRKGYEEVLFPAGDTATKVEGHQTVEDFITMKQQRLDEVLTKQEAVPSRSELPAEQRSKWKQLTYDIPYDEESGHGGQLNIIQHEDGYEDIEFISTEDGQGDKLTRARDGDLINKLIEESGEPHIRTKDIKGVYEERPTVKEDFDPEIKQLNKEIGDARAGKLQIGAVARFYESTIQNILNKQQYSPERITDEYGNDWFKVKLKDDYKQTIYYNKGQETPKSFEERAVGFLKKEGLINLQQENIGGKKEWVVKRTQPGSYEEKTGKVIYVLSHNIEKIGQINDNYHEKMGFRPFNLRKISTKTWVVDINKDGTLFNRGAQGVEDARNLTLSLLSTLQNKTGLPFEIITEDKAQELTQGAKNPWNGEGAFYKDGKVYLLEGGVNLTNTFHEYSHPFVAAIRLANSEYYNRLFQDFIGRPEAQDILDEVTRNYPELVKGSDQFKDEVLVRAITEVAQGNISKENIQGFWSRLWFGIKQFFRSVFGQNRDLSKLDETTTLQDLGKMLTDGSKIALPVEHDDYVLFNRDIAKEMEDIPTGDIMKSIETFHRVALDHLGKLRENKNYTALRDVLKNQADGSILNDISKLLDLSRQTESKMDDDFKKLNNFARAVVGARILGDKMSLHVREMSKVDMDDRDRLNTMRYYSFIANDWLDAFEQLREINKDDKHLLSDEIARAESNFKRINDFTSEAYKKGLVQVLKPQLEPINQYVETELKPELDKTQQLVSQGDTKLVKRLEYLKKMYEHGRFDDQKIIKLLEGELGDTNWFSSMFEAYSSSPDPIVGGFAAFFNKQMYKVEAAVQTHTTELGNKLAPLYKEYGVDISKPEELGKQLTYLDTVFSKDANGNPQGVQVHKYLNEFSGGHEYDYQNLQHQLDDAKESGDKEKSIKLQKEFDQMKKDYFHREYVDEIYNAREFWNESDINRVAQQRRKDITDQLSGYEAEAGFKDLTDEDRDHMNDLLVQLRTLSSTKNLDGSDKTGEDLGVAQAIQEFNKRMIEYKEEIPMKGAFERDMQTFRDDLLDKGLDEKSDDYNKGLNAWLKENLRVRLSDKFYDDRQRIIDQISEIVSKLGRDEAKQLDVSKTWKGMFEQVKGFRDQDNQPVGTSLTPEKVAAVKKLQERINEVTESLRRLNGLTSIEQESLSKLWGQQRAGIPLDEADQKEYNEMLTRKQLLGITPADKGRLTGLFEELKEFQSKIPTEYYLTAMNQKLNEAGMQEEVSMQNAEAFLDVENMREFFGKNDNAFTRWFNANHIERVKFDPTSQQHKLMYERLYIWNRIVPNNEAFKKALATNDYQSLLALKSPMVEIKPASKYFFYRIKNEYRTQRVVGKTVDNRGNWLPKTIEQGAKDGKYRNEQFHKLRNSTDHREQTLFRILQTYKESHLKSQEDAPRYTRLWYEVPRVRKERIENIEALLDQPRRTAKNMIDWIGNAFNRKSKPDAFDNSVASKKDLQDEQKMYVATDLFGTQINSIPMKYMSKLNHELVSLDLGRSSIKYALGLQINKALHEINPIAQALQNTVAEHGIKDLNKVSSRNWGNKFMNSVPVLSRENVRLKTISNMIERDIEGVENHMELGLTGSKVAKHLMGVAAFGSLALNIPAGVKNVVVAKLQNILEANSNEFFSQKNLQQADKIFFNRFMPKLIHDYNRFSNRSLETQMFELFDFVQGKFEEHVGESFSASYKKDIAHLRFTRSFQTLGELQAQGQAGIAMMVKQLVPWTHEGVTTQIRYLDAWELKNGVIDLKDGVDKSWGKNGDNFAGFKLKMHKINELMQGAYAKMNQSEATRYTSFKMINFMRRYLVPGIVNRFTVNRNNVALGTQREGYYMTAWRVGMSVARNGLDNWHVLTPKEKRNVYKTLTELGYSLGFLALITMMGYNSDDPDKNKKLKDSSWAHNMALYELVMIKGEIENFIPLPGMGLNEILRMKDQPSIAFPMLNKYYKIISHLMDLVQQPFTDYDITHYRQSSGIYKKGDLKIVADLLKAIGYTGATLHPDNAVKTYMATTNRYN